MPKESFNRAGLHGTATREKDAGERGRTGRGQGEEYRIERERVDAVTRKDRYGGEAVKEGGRECEGPENEFRF